MAWHCASYLASPRCASNLYRPIWLRNSSVRVKYADVADYIYTLHGAETEWKNFPEMVD